MTAVTEQPFAMAGAGQVPWMGGPQAPAMGFGGGQACPQGAAWGRPARAALSELVCMLRRTALDNGPDAAIDRCRQEGRFLAGYSVYCHPTSDRELVRKFVELASGEWLEKPPDTAFSSSVPVLIFSDLPEWWAGSAPGGNMGYGVEASGHMGGLMPGAIGGPPMGGVPLGSFMAGGMPGVMQASWAPQSRGYDMWLQPQALQPLRPSTDAYLEQRLRPEDVEGYVAAGIQLFRKTEDGPEFLFAFEQPWNSWNNDYDPLAWNILGAKRGRSKGGWEINPHSTAVRCALEVLGGVEGAPTGKDIRRMCRQSVAIWYPRGKYALFLHEVLGQDAAALENPSLSERFAAAKSEGNVPPRMMQGEPRLDGSTKYTKQIEDLQWVPAKELLVEKPNLTDLLDNFCQIEAFRNFLSGGNLPPPAEAFTQGEPEVPEADADGNDIEVAGPQKGGKGKSSKGKGDFEKGGKGRAKNDWGKGTNTLFAKGMWDKGGGDFCKGGFDKGGFDKGGLINMGKTMGGKAMGGKMKSAECMGGNAKGDWDKGFGGKGMMNCMKGDLDKGMSRWEKGAGGKMKGMEMEKGMVGKAKGDMGGKMKGSWEKGMDKGKGKPMNEEPANENSTQMLGERLYVLVQSMVPSIPVAQKVTGMLLELPTPELLALFEQANVGNVPGASPTELEQRVQEAMEILKEDGIV